MSILARLVKCQDASAAAEMALVLPLLTVVLFGAVEVGKYFRDEHIVIEAVRDGARYAARQQMVNFIDSASACQTTPLGTVVDDTKNVVRTGNKAGTGSRISYWTDNSTITVTSDCLATAGGEDMEGIYAGVTFGGAPVGAPVVTVSASIPYESLFGLPQALNLNAEQQAAVMGL